MADCRSAHRNKTTDNVSPPDRAWTTSNVAEATPGVLNSLGVSLFVDNVGLPVREIWSDCGIRDRAEVYLPDMAGDQIADGLVLRGVPASPGTIEARVCGVEDLVEVDQLEEGDDIVAVATNPSWTPLFMISGGVVVDVGTAASHAAIIARELHLPCVMNTGRATAQLPTGDIVRVNGDAGSVELLGSAK